MATFEEHVLAHGGVMMLRSSSLEQSMTIVLATTSPCVATTIFSPLAQRMVELGFQVDLLPWDVAGQSVGHEIVHPYAAMLVFHTTNEDDGGGGAEMQSFVQIHESGPRQIPVVVHYDVKNKDVSFAPVFDTVSLIAFNFCVGRMALFTPSLYKPRLAARSVLATKRSDKIPAERSVFTNCDIGLVFEIEHVWLQLDNHMAQQKLLWDMDCGGDGDGDGKSSEVEATTLAREDIVRFNIQPFFRAMALTSPDDRKEIESVLHKGLDLRIETGGRYGRGIYFCEYPIDALMYTPSGRSRQPVAIFVCDVTLGKVCMQPKGVYCPHLFTEPPGYHSLYGAMRFGQGVVQYRPHLSLVTHVAFCRSQIISP